MQSAAFSRVTENPRVLDRANHQRREMTLVMAKQNAVQLGLSHVVFGAFERRGFQLHGIKLVQPTAIDMQAHYHGLSGRAYWQDLVHWSTEGPVLIMAWAGPGAVAKGREVLDRIRKEYAVGARENLVHASDSPEEAREEIALWFGAGGGFVTRLLDPYPRLVNEGLWPCGNNPPKTFVFCGPSGVGKNTLMKAISRLGNATPNARELFEIFTPPKEFTWYDAEDHIGRIHSAGRHAMVTQDLQGLRKLWKDPARKYELGVMALRLIPSREPFLQQIQRLEVRRQIRGDQPTEEKAVEQGKDDLELLRQLLNDHQNFEGTLVNDGSVEEAVGKFLKFAGLELRSPK